MDEPVQLSSKNVDCCIKGYGAWLSSTTVFNKTASTTPMGCCNTRLEVVLGLEDLKEVVGGSNRVTTVEG
jgi:hypothetical protein